jgi:KDO2-lipid IV(A) lauroyltransferase
VDKKSISRAVKHIFSSLALNFFLILAGIIPLDWFYKISRCLGRLAYVFAAKHRNIAQEGLLIAFSDKLDANQRKEIIINSFQETVRGALESVILLKKPRVLNSRVSIKNIKYLEQALARGKGVICVSAHFGNFILLAAHLQMSGFPTAVVLRSMRDEKMDAFLLKKRQQFGIESIYTKPPKECVDKSLAFLKKNGVVVNLLDQNFGSGRGIFVEFFGRQAATAIGPVVLAMRSKAALLPMFIVRKEDNAQEIIIEPEFELEKLEDFDQTVQRNISRLTKIIENYIRNYPAQWSWIHRRWKSQPSEQTVFED